MTEIGPTSLPRVSFGTLHAAETIQSAINLHCATKRLVNLIIHPELVEEHLLEEDREGERWLKMHQLAMIHTNITNKLCPTQTFWLAVYYSTSDDSGASGEATCHVNVHSHPKPTGGERSPETLYRWQMAELTQAFGRLIQEAELVG